MALHNEKKDKYEKETAWKFVNAPTVQQAAVLMTGMNPCDIVFNPHPQYFHETENKISINSVQVHFEMLRNAITDGNLIANSKYSVRFRIGTDDQPGENEENHDMFGWFNVVDDDIGKYDLIVGTVPDWSKTTIRRADIIEWLQKLGYNDKHFNPESDTANEKRRRYSPKLDAAEKVYEALADDEMLNKYLNKAVKRTLKEAIKAWLNDNAKKFPKLLDKDGKIPPHAINNIAAVVNWDKGGRPPKKTLAINARSRKL